MDEYYLEVEKIFTELINEDISYLIIKELKFLNNLVTCMKCKKRKHKKYISDNEYMCSNLCGFCGICISGSNICLKCVNSVIYYNSSNIKHN